MKKYQPAEIESKWQEKWASSELYKVDLANAHDQDKNYYILVEFTYPSGDLHIGHWFTFAIPDILARMKRMQGYKVFFPNGFDAFGLPAENAAIKRGIHPSDWTHANIKRMKEQFATMGASYDWGHEVITCDPIYYRWNQWIFLKMFEKGLAYKGKMISNWCPSCKTVVANENVEAGKCWRCGTEVIQKEVEQWFFKITDYADRLLWDEQSEAKWPKALVEGQNNWIGKSSGILLTFKVEGNSQEIEVFTTAIDTVFGVTFLAISPEHPIVASLMSKNPELSEYVEQAKKKSELKRKEDKDKTGVFSGLYAINPLSGAKIPVWIAEYILAGYGTGAVMGVPGHDVRDHEFALKFNLPVKAVIKPKEGVPGSDVKDDGFWDYHEIESKFHDWAVLFDSEDYNGLTAKETKEKISKYIASNNLGSEKINYHLHDWSISRQRYWGTPIPIINCPNCGVVAVPETDLPVELPYEIDYTPRGKPPLATVDSWINVKCPKCDGPATREPETMDTFVDSSWYFFRYLDPLDESKLTDKELVKKWMPVDIYFGGAEHTLGHALYSRFFTQFLHDLGFCDFDEYAKMRIHHGVILGPDGARMSKSKGNVVNPDEQVKNYGADAVRIYLAFLGPYDIVAPWNSGGIFGVYHFLERVWGLSEKIGDEGSISKDNLRILNKTIKKVGDDINATKFNTAVASLMEWLNHLSRKEKVSREEYKTFLILLAPFAPHISEELWSHFAEASRDDKSWSVHQQAWPRVDERSLEDEEKIIMIQVNGKVRGQIKIGIDLLNKEKDVENSALQDLNIQKYLAGKTMKKTIYVPGRILNFLTD